MYDLSIKGCGAGPMGVRAIAQWLNERGYRLKAGKLHNSNVADMLSRHHNTGFYMDGKDKRVRRNAAGSRAGPRFLPRDRQLRHVHDRCGDPSVAPARAAPPRVVNGSPCCPRVLHVVESRAAAPA